MENYHSSNNSGGSGSLTAGRRRPRSDGSLHGRHRRQHDARILRGAEILRQQLIHDNSNSNNKKNSTRIQNNSSRATTTEPWKSRTKIQQETERIRKDLSRTASPLRRPSPLSRRELLPAITASSSPMRSVSPIRPEGSLEEDQEDVTAFEDLWDTPTRQMKNVQDKLQVRHSINNNNNNNNNTIETQTMATFATPDPALWAEISSLGDTSAAAREVAPAIVTPQQQRQEDNGGRDTPVSFMGRDRKIPTKSHTYLVQAFPSQQDDDEEEEDEDYDFVENDYDDDDVDIALAAYRDHRPLKKKHSRSSNNHNYLPHNLVSRPQTPFVRSYPNNDSLDSTEEHYNDLKKHTSNNNSNSSPTSTIDMAPPTLAEYGVLLADPAYLHAQQAGFLWQSLVGQHVRFPRHWWDGARAPPLGANNTPWQYVQVTPPVPKHPLLQKLVRNRAAPGRLLLHVIVQDDMTRRPVWDIAVGCFHPNARGIRMTAYSDKGKEKTRQVWLAVRQRSSSGATPSMDPWKDVLREKSPVPGQRVNNSNMRVIFGEKPPMETIFVPEMELCERLTSQQYAPNPALALLEDFVFS